MSDKRNLKYLTSWRSRHRKRRYFFARGHKYPLAGEPGSVEFHSAYTRLLAELEAKTLGRRETAYIKGTIGWVIEKYLAADQFTKEKAKNTKQNYNRESKAGRCGFNSRRHRRLTLVCHPPLARNRSRVRPNP